MSSSIIPQPSPTGRASHRAIVKEIIEVAPHHYQLRLQCPLLACSVKPGQFVHVLTTPQIVTNVDNWVFDPLLRRAFSIMSVDSNNQEMIQMLFRVEGRGTQALAQVCVEDKIDLLGPLGKPFDITPFQTKTSGQTSTVEKFHVKQSVPEAIIVGGGVGVPPLVFLSQFLKSNGIQVHAIIGAKTANDVVCYDELSAVCKSISVATDDGSRGHRGRVTDLLANLFGELGSESVGINPIVYACGPLPMLRAVAQMCMAADVKCQVSLEENMPCGVGVCNGCVVRTRQPFAENMNANIQGVHDTIGNEWSPYRAYRRVCVEGPACWADEIDWEHQK